MTVVYLDQNKWIELARAAKYPAEHPDAHALLTAVEERVSSGKLVLPLTATNIFETHKINDASRRHDLAFVQAGLSKGRVFRGRYKRLEAEIAEFVARVYGLPAPARAPDWFLSSVFFEAFAEWGDERFDVPIPESVMTYMRAQPSDCLYEHLVATPEDVRVAAVKRFSDGSEALRQRIENRRARHKDEPIEMRRNIYAALLIIDEIDLIIRFANKVGMAWKNVAEMGETTVRRLATDIPIYDVEREISVRLEAQSRSIHANDFRDMQSFCGVVPYADVVIAENQFVSLAKQAKVDKKYNTQISTSVLALKDCL